MIHSCKVCAKRNHCIYKPTSEVADCGYFVRSTQEQKQTNYDRIHAMSVEELAEWLTKITNDAQSDSRTKCDYQWDEWLKSEAKE